MFATEKRSPVKFIALLVIGATLAIGGGALAAWLFLGDGDKEDDDKEVVTPTPPKDDSGGPPNDPPPKEGDDEGLVIAAEGGDEGAGDEGAGDEGAGDEGAGDEGAGDEGGGDEGGGDKGGGDKGGGDEGAGDGGNVDTSKRGGGKKAGGGHKGGGGGKKGGQPPQIKDSLTSADVTKGFLKARGKAKACSGIIPGMKIKISVTINAEGNVLSSSAQGLHAGKPYANCVAAAVKSSAKFPKTKRGLDSKSYTFGF
jgi:hypothetical protein